jgi:predicted nuclease of predicted toxin-antitoxin system
MRFLADMGISPRTVEWLRQQGYDSVHLVEEGLNVLSDEDIIHKARTENRIVLTVDLDFGYLLAISQANLPSVVIFRLGNASRSVVQSRLVEVLNLCSEDLLSGALISVSEKTIRVRQLPM